MDHLEAVRLDAATLYILQELPPELSEEFEEHFFECPECAADLHGADVVLGVAATELKARAPAPPPRQTAVVLELPAGTAAAASAPPPASGRSDRAASGWLAVAALAAAVLLAIGLGYQSWVVQPRLSAEIHRLSQASRPGIVPVHYLPQGDSLGAEDDRRVIVASALQPIVLSVDIPVEERFSAYQCVLLSAAGQALWQVPVSASQAERTVYISIPAGTVHAGSYTLVVQGRPKGQGQLTDLVPHPFEVRIAE